MIPLWLHKKLEVYQDWITILFILSSIVSISGISMAPLMSQLLHVSPLLSLQIIAFLNTFITFVVIGWGLKHKRRLKRIEKILRDNGMNWFFVSNEVKIRWNQEPSEEQKRIAIAEINGILREK